MMKFLSILAAASLALTPAIASAGSDTGSTDDEGRPISGPLGARYIDGQAIPPGAIVIGGLVLIGGALFLLLVDNDSNNDTNGDGEEE
jgi:hypothetical protein